MARNPRTLLRILTFARLSSSSTGWATSRSKWLWQERCGVPGNSAAIAVTNASCLSDIPPPHRRVYALGPLTGQDDHTAHLLHRTRQQGLSTPHTLAHQLAHHIERFMAFFRLRPSIVSTNAAISR